MQIRYAQPLDAQGPDPTPVQDTLTPLPMPAPSTPTAPSTNGVIAPAPPTGGFGDMMPARSTDRQLPGWPQQWQQPQQLGLQDWSAPQQQQSGFNQQNMRGLMQWLSRMFGQFGQG